MALKATIYKAAVNVADLDRNQLLDANLTLAQHPSENDARMMIRLLAFMLYADERLEFGKGLSTDEEPDLWLKDLTCVIKLWIYVGQLDERWLRKASGRADRVVVISYGDRVAEVALDRADRQVASAREHRGGAVQLGGVADGRAGRVALEQGDIGR